MKVYGPGSNFQKNHPSSPFPTQITSTYLEADRYKGAQEAKLRGRTWFERQQGATVDFWEKKFQVMGVGVGETVFLCHMDFRKLVKVNEPLARRQVISRAMRVLRAKEGTSQSLQVPNLSWALGWWLRLSGSSQPSRSSACPGKSLNPRGRETKTYVQSQPPESVYHWIFEQWIFFWISNLEPWRPRNTHLRFWGCRNCQVWNNHRSKTEFLAGSRHCLQLLTHLVLTTPPWDHSYCTPYFTNVETETPEGHEFCPRSLS